jgi:hypothetical protein
MAATVDACVTLCCNQADSAASSSPPASPCLAFSFEEGLLDLPVTIPAATYPVASPASYHFIEPYGPNIITLPGETVWRGGAYNLAGTATAPSVVATVQSAPCHLLSNVTALVPSNTARGGISPTLLGL